MSPKNTARRLSPSDQDHLRAIYDAGGGEGLAAMGRVAELVGNSPAAVTAAAKRLHGMGLVDYRRYRGVQLTEAGTRVALEMVRHHRLIESFLVEFLGYDWNDVHREADRLEHAISEELERRIAARISDPTTDPHGHMIPSERLETPHESARPLSSARVGDSLVVASVSDRDPDILAYLTSIGLRPGGAIEVVERLPFEGPLAIELNGQVHHLGRLVTDNVYVMAAAGEREVPRERSQASGGPR